MIELRFVIVTDPVAVDCDWQHKTQEWFGYIHHCYLRRARITK